ncbi:MAG: SDR family NAD(P)-dependent oxidoreductase, partial [Gemmatimonadetes bacterium]|nr:SDR family NAD(P)-dependent oxidoreductase [Gemmatimonadota bacterium]
MTVETKKDLEGLVAVVTGAAQGLGFGIARELARRGAQMIVADVQLNKAEEACEQMRADGLVAHAAQLDITDSAAVN